MHSSLSIQVPIQTMSRITRSELYDCLHMIYSLSFGQMLDSWSAGPNAELHSAGMQRATAVWQQSTISWSCLQVALRWFCSRSLMRQEGLTKELIDRIPGKQTDRKTPLGELNWIFTAITDTIAWNMLPRSLFQRLFRQAKLHTSSYTLLTSQSYSLPSASCHLNLLHSPYKSELHNVTQNLPAIVAISTIFPVVTSHEHIPALDWYDALVAMLLIVWWMQCRTCW